MGYIYICCFSDCLWFPDCYNSCNRLDTKLYCSITTGPIQFKWLERDEGLLTFLPCGFSKWEKRARFARKGGMTSSRNKRSTPTPVMEMMTSIRCQSLAVCNVCVCVCVCVDTHMTVWACENGTMEYLLLGGWVVKYLVDSSHPCQDCSICQTVANYCHPSSQLQADKNLYGMSV